MAKTCQAAISLLPWTEVTGFLKEIRTDTGEAVVEIRGAICLRLSAEELNQLDGMVGKRVSILRTDRNGKDKAVVRIFSEGDER